MTSPPITGADLMDEQGLSAAGVIRKAMHEHRYNQDQLYEIYHGRGGDVPDLADYIAEQLALHNTRSPPPGEVREEVARRIEVILRDEIGRQFSAARDDGLNDVRIATIVPRATGRILALSASPIQGGGPMSSEDVRKFALAHDHLAIPIRPGVALTWTDEETGEVINRATIKGRNVVALPAPPVPTEETE